MDLTPFRFDLPADRIALRPADPQDTARLLVVRAGGALEDHTVRDLPGLLKSTDVLVFNETRVIAAFLKAVRPARGPEGQDVVVDINLIEKVGPQNWRALARPGRRLRVGDPLLVSEDLSATITQQFDGGEIELAFSLSGDALEAALDGAGAMPLPPYIARRRPADAADRDTYQTRFARGDARSVAAPTAGLHFTPRLLADLDAAGIARETVRLDIGMGTFKPLTETHLQTHRLHAEHRHLDAATAARLNAARAQGRRCVAVGTTALRTLESASDLNRQLQAVSGPTQIFLKPGDRMRATDALITNFHLPESSLFMLVCTLMGTDVMQAAYAHAIASGYRFYSYGDACLLLP